MKTDFATVFRDRLWDNNPGLAQLLGLCPLLAVSDSLVKAIGLGLATLITLCLSSVSISLARKILRPEIRISAYLLVIATIVTIVELSFQAWFYELYLALGIFVPLIATNCIIFARAELFAAHNRPLPAFIDALATGMGFGLVLLVLGAVRELLGQGTLFAQARLLLGDGFTGYRLLELSGYPGFLIIVLPPGAFISLGLLVAIKNKLESRRAFRNGQRRLVTSVLSHAVRQDTRGEGQ